MPRHYINPDSPRVSLLIIREQFDRHILNILSSIQENSYPYYEVIVVNIGATESEENELYKYFPNLKQLTLNGQTEKEYALSEGLKMAQGEFLLFLNNIEEINQDFIEKLVFAARKSSRIAIVSPQVRSYKHKEINLFRAADQPKGLSNYLNYSSYHATEAVEDSARFAHFACNDAFLISMEYLHKIEEKQKGSFFFLDEIDIAETVHENRYKIYYEPNAIAYLDDEFDARSTYYKTRNRIASIRKHKHGLMLVGLMLFFSVSSIPKHTFHHLLHLRLDHIFAFYRGVIWNVFHSVKSGGFLSNIKWKHPF